MCGIVGLYLKNQSMEPELGRLFNPMLISMSERGPDSAGFAIYGDEVTEGRIKVTLRHDDLNYSWVALLSYLQGKISGEVSYFQNFRVTVFKIAASATVAINLIKEFDQNILVLSAGQSIEILKEVGLPENIANSFNLNGMQGTHIIGHTRMATESAVTMAGSHPFSTGLDLCLVHNGSLSNHNRLRTFLKMQGVEFETENDTEVGAGFLTWRLQQGDTLKQALEAALESLDGFYTFAIGTKNGFAVLRDPIACKPAVMAETDDYVAMASEYRALTDLPGIEQAKVWEPEPATIYTWEREAL